MISVEPIVLKELRLRLLLSLESSWMELWSLDEAVDGCAFASMLVVAMVVVVASGMTVVPTSGFTSVATWLATWLGRYSSSGISTTDSATDSKSLSSSVSANAANGLAVPIDAVVAAAVGVTTFGVSFITPVVDRLFYLVMLKNKTHYLLN